MIWFFIALGFILYFVLDVNYFLRVIAVYVFAKYFRKKIEFGEPSSIYAVCLPTDADFMLTHMNNSRYLREYDFARFDYITRTGLMDVFLKAGASFPVASCVHRYRQPLWMFYPYKVITTPVYWDSKTVYLEQRIVTLPDNIVRTVGYTKIAIVKMDFEATLKKYFPNLKKPEIPKDLQKLIEFNEISSENMKKGK